VLRIIRPLNLFLIAILQIVALYSLGEYNYLLYNPEKTLYLIASTLLIAAGGYIINDYFDIKIDQINKPDKVVIGISLSRRLAIILHITFTASGLFLAWLVNYTTLALAAISALLLYFYSSSYKKQFLIGNLVIAILGAMSIVICQAYIGYLHQGKVLAYAVFAGLITLIREVVKDQEDIRGDEAFQSTSLAIVLGLRKTKTFLLSITALLLLAILVYPFLAWSFYEDSTQRFFIYMAYIAVGVLAPLLLFIFRLVKADTQSEFHNMSGLLKFIMLNGILSMILS
jgi:4-hydroxybenzoate polyprenyltransferase